MRTFLRIHSVFALSWNTLTAIRQQLGSCIAALVLLLIFISSKTAATPVPKPILLIFYSNACGHCQELQKAMQQNASFAKDLEDQYQIRKIEVSTPEGQMIARHWNVKAVPVLVVNSSESVVNRIQGFSTLERLEQQLLQKQNNMTATGEANTARVGIALWLPEKTQNACAPNPHPYSACLQQVYDVDPFCCTTSWDPICESEYTDFGCMDDIQPVASQTVCENTSAILLSFSTTGIGLSYQWYSSPTSSTTTSVLISGAQSATYTPPTNATGTTYYYVKVTGTNVNKTSSFAEVVVNPQPQVTITANPSATLTCASPSLTLTATSSATALRWSTGETTVSISVSAAGAYSVTTTGPNGCTAVSNSLTISQNTTPPPVNLAVSGTLTCAQTAVTLTASNGDSYAFSGPVGGPAGVVNTAGNLATVNAGGIYSVTVINATTGCFDSATLVVQSNTLTPSVSITPSTGTLTCSQGTLILTANTTANTLRWTDGSANSTLVVSASGTYGLSVTAANGCSATASSVTIAQNFSALPTISLTASASAFSCQSANILLTATPGASTYRFSGPGSFNQSGPANTVTVSTSGVYSVTAGTGICSATATLSLTGATGAPPNALLLGSGNLSCQTPTLSLTALGGSFYSFSGPGIVSQTDGRERVVVGGYVIFKTPIPTIGQAVVNKPGLYMVLVTGPDGCTSTAQIVVTGTECR